MKIELADKVLVIVSSFIAKAASLGRRDV